MWLRQTFSNSIYLGLVEKVENSDAFFDFSIVSNPLTRWLPNGVLKQDLLEA